MNSQQHEFLLRGKVTIADDGCWVWGLRLAHGYGRLKWDGRISRAHRIAHVLWRGPVPPAMVVDHICRLRSCVNPAHLRSLSRGENVLSGVTISAVKKRQLICGRGHRLSGANLYLWADEQGRTHRKCIACQRVATKRSVSNRSPGRRSEMLAYYRNYNKSRSLKESAHASSPAA